MILNSFFAVLNIRNAVPFDELKGGIVGSSQVGAGFSNGVESLL